MIKEKHKFEDWIVSVDANAFSGEGIVILPKTVKIVSNVENNANIFITSSGVIISSKNEIPSNEIWYRSDEICNFGQSDIAIQESTEDNEYGCKRHIFSEDLVILPQGIFSRINPDLIERGGVKNIFIPNSVTSIGAYAFAYCSSLTSINIPNSVTSIGEWAFFDCQSLTSITIPNSVTSIRNDAFSSCSSLTSITCEAITPPTLDSGNNLSNVTVVYVPAESIDTYKTSTNWSYYSGIIKPIE